MRSPAKSVRRCLLPLAVGSGVLIAVTACGSSAKPAAGSSGGSGSSGICTKGAPGSGDAAVIKSFAFYPCPLTVKAGTKVTWTNDKGDPIHTVTSDSADPASFDSGNLNPGNTFSFTFAKAGKYTYTCTIHPFMHGEVDVS